VATDAPPSALPPGYPEADLFSQTLIQSYVGLPHFVERSWLLERVESYLALPSCRFVLLIGESGAGKSAFLAWLASRQRRWPRYFIRRDSRTPLRAGDASSFLFATGHQLAALRPALFHPDLLELVVTQRVGEVAAGGRVVGITVKDLYISPFYRTAIRIEQDAGIVSGSLEGLSANRVVAEKRFLDVGNLQYLALFDPASALLLQDPSEQIVILLDALDELRYQPGENSVLHWLARCPEMPPNVRFVLTSRPDDDLLRAFRNGQRDRLVELPIDPRSESVRRDVREYAIALAGDEGLGPLLVRQGSTPEDFAGRAAAKSRGNFQYLAALFRGITQAAEANQQEQLARLLRLTELPDDLVKLYAFFMSLIREQVAAERIEVPGSGPFDTAYASAWEGIYRPVLGVLAVALEPLTFRQIKNFAGIVAEDRWVQAALERLRQFMERPNGGYGLYHASFSEFLTDPSLGSSEPQFYLNTSEWHRKICAWYRGKAPTWDDVSWSTADDYGLRHLAAHLFALVELAGRDPASPFRRELYGLACKSLMRATEERWGSHQPFAATLALAASAAASETPPNLVEEVRVGLIRTTIASVAANVPESIFRVCAMLRQAERARGLAELIADPQKRHDAYFTIVRSLHKAGLLDDARNLLDSLEAEADIRRDPADRASALADVAASLSVSGGGDRAARVAARALNETASITDKCQRAWAYGYLALTMATPGLRREALEAAERAWSDLTAIRESSSKAHVLARAAWAFAASGKQDRLRQATTDALALLKGSEEFNLSWTLGTLLGALGESGADENSELTKSVLVILESADTPATVLSRLRNVLYLVSNAGHPAKTAQLASLACKLSEETGELTHDIDTLATMLVQGGRREEASAATNRALALAEKLGPDENRAHALSRIATAFLAVGEPVAAVQTARQSVKDAASITDPDDKDWAGQTAAAVLARALEASNPSSIEDALAAAMTIENGEGRARALADVAEIVALAGDHDGAAEVLNETLKALEVVGDENPRANALASIAGSLADFGLRESAETAIRAALRLADGIDLEVPRSKVLERGSAVLARIGLEAEAVQLVERLLALDEGVAAMGYRNTPNGTIWNLSNIVRILGQAGAFDRAMAVAERSSDPGEMAWELSVLALVLAESGRFDRSVEAADRCLARIPEIESPEYLLPALHTIANALKLAGKYEESAEAARRAQTIAENIEDLEYRSYWLTEIASTLANTGQLDRSASTARGAALAATLMLQRNRAPVLSEIALALHETGQSASAAVTVSEALEAADASRNIVVQVRTFRSVAELLSGGDGPERRAKIGRQLAELAQGLDPPSLRAWLLSELAATLSHYDPQSAVSLTRAARQSGRRMAYGATKTMWLVNLADSLLSTGDRVNAARLTPRLINAVGSARKPSDEELIQVAAALHRIGRTSEAVPIARRALSMLEPEPTRERVRILAEFTETLADIGMSDQASKVAGLALNAAVSGSSSSSPGIDEHENSAHERAEAHAFAACALAAAGRLERGSETARRALADLHSSDNFRGKAGALAATARALFRTGDVKAGADSAAEALTSARTADRRELAHLQAQLAGALTRAADPGATEAARAAAQTSETIPHDGKRVLAWCEIAPVLHEAGIPAAASDLLDRAAVLVGMLPGGSGKLAAWGRVAVALARTGRTAAAIDAVRQAIAAADGIATAHDRLEALELLAGTLLHNSLRSNALSAWRAGFALQEDRNKLYWALYAGAPILAAIDGGATLGRISDAVQEVETWWT
jgi:tetratricopeptide (TPR) repeat protein